MLGESVGYKTEVKSAVVTKLRDSISGTFPSTAAGFEGVSVGIDYPMVEGMYPYVMLEFQEKSLRAIGLGHGETYEIDPDGELATHFRRWKFTGSFVFSFYALRAKERDLLTDAFVKSVGFDEGFRNDLAENEYVGIMVNTQEILGGGETSGVGTPWGTDEMVYVTSYTLDVEGEFFTDIKASVIIKRIEIYSRLEGEPDTHSQGTWI